MSGKKQAVRSVLDVPLRDPTAYQAIARASRANKYGAKKCRIDGYTFDSQAEARRYGELKLLERAGEITHLTVHPKYRLYAGITYIADFAYSEMFAGGTMRVVEDVKGVETAVFKLKAKLFRADYPGTELRVVKC